MHTGLEDTEEFVLVQLTSNLKSGVLRVVNMGPAALVSDNPKECPPCAAFENNLSMLQAFKAECNQRGIDYENITPVITEIEEMWLDARE